MYSIALDNILARGFRKSEKRVRHRNSNALRFHFFNLCLKSISSLFVGMCTASDHVLTLKDMAAIERRVVAHGGNYRTLQILVPLG